MILTKALTVGVSVLNFGPIPPGWEPYEIRFHLQVADGSANGTAAYIIGLSRREIPNTAGLVAVEAFHLLTPAAGVNILFYTAVALNTAPGPNARVFLPVSNPTGLNEVGFYLSIEQNAGNSNVFGTVSVAIRKVSKYVLVDRGDS